MGQRGISVAMRSILFESCFCEQILSKEMIQWSKSECSKVLNKIDFDGEEKSLKKRISKLFTGRRRRRRILRSKIKM